MMHLSFFRYSSLNYSMFRQAPSVPFLIPKEVVIIRQMPSFLSAKVG